MKTCPQEAVANRVKTYLNKWKEVFLRSEHNKDIVSIFYFIPA
jgi:hypothetical protein